MSGYRAHQLIWVKRIQGGEHLECARKYMRWLLAKFVFEARGIEPVANNLADKIRLCLD